MIPGNQILNEEVSFLFIKSIICWIYNHLQYYWKVFEKTSEETRTMHNRIGSSFDRFDGNDF